MTGRDLVSAVMRLIGAIAPGDTPTASEATDGLAALNRMIDSWSNEGLMIYSSVREPFSLVAGTARYSMGSGGTFNTSRPMKITQLGLVISLIEYPVSILSLEEWASVSLKSLSTTIPAYAFLEGTYPLEEINLYPVPSTASSLIVYSDKPLATIATLDTVISLPLGYERALTYNGAIELSAEYGRAPNELVMLIATESKASIKRSNHRSSYLGMDNALLSKRSFNFISGGSR